MNKNDRREDGGEEQFQWNPEWDFMDADEISEIAEKDAEDAKSMTEFLTALGDLSSDEDRMPEESRRILNPIFREVFQKIDEDRKAFAESNIILNLPQYKRFCEGVAFAKDLRDRGLITGFTPKFFKGKKPSELILTFDTLKLVGDDRKKFAAMLEGASSYRLGGIENGPATATLGFSDMWLPVVVKTTD